MFGERVDPQHDASHFPSAQDGELWQESGAFGWYDPATRIGSWQHVGIARGRGVADVNSFISHRGEIVGRYQHLSLPLPSGDFSAFSLGPLSLQTRQPLASHLMTIRHERVRAEVVLDTQVGPYWMNYHDAKNHWEGFGRVHGTVHIDDQPIKVAGHCFMNRSWGARDWSTMLSYRIVTAVFGPDLIFRLFQATRPGQYAEHGYILDRGELLPVDRVDSEFAMASDGVSVVGAQATAWSTSGVAYKLSGRTVDCDVMTQRNNFMNAHGNAVFECGGRVGTGFLIAVELKAPTQAHRQRLGLE